MGLGPSLINCTTALRKKLKPSVRVERAGQRRHTHWDSSVVLMREFALVGGICHRKPERKRRTSVSRWLWCWQKLISLWNQNYIYLCSHSLLPTRTKLQSTLASRHCLRPDHMISVRQLTLCPTCRNYFMTLRPSQKIRNGFCIIHTGVHKKKKMFSKLDQRCFFYFTASPSSPSL